MKSRGKKELTWQSNHYPRVSKKSTYSRLHEMPASDKYVDSALTDMKAKAAGLDLECFNHRLYLSAEKGASFASILFNAD